MSTAIYNNNNNADTRVAKSSPATDASDGYIRVVKCPRGNRHLNRERDREADVTAYGAVTLNRNQLNGSVKVMKATIGYSVQRSRHKPAVAKPKSPTPVVVVAATGPTKTINGTFGKLVVPSVAEKKLQQDLAQLRVGRPQLKELLSVHNYRVHKCVGGAACKHTVCCFYHTEAERRARGTQRHDGNVLAADYGFYVKQYKMNRCTCGQSSKLCGSAGWHDHSDRRRALRMDAGTGRWNYSWQRCSHTGDGTLWRTPTLCNDKCPYSHSWFEQAYHPDIYKTLVCAVVQEGRACPNGLSCSYMHEGDTCRRSATLEKPSDITLTTHVSWALTIQDMAVAAAAATLLPLPIVYAVAIAVPGGPDLS